MKASVLLRTRPMWMLLILVTLGDASPQGYHYPAPTNASTTTTPTTAVPNEEEVTKPQEETTAISLSDYIIDGRDDSSSTAENIESTTQQDTEIPNVTEVPGTDAPEQSITEQPTSNSDDEKQDEKEVKETEAVTEKEAEEEKEGSGNGEKEKKDDSPTGSEKGEDVLPSTDVSMPEDERKEKLSEASPETTSTSDDTDTTTLSSAPYPPSGQRPPEPQFSYGATDQLSEGSTTTSSSSSISPDPTEPTTTTTSQPRLVNPLQDETLVSGNQDESEARVALTSSVPQQPYFYQPPPQQPPNNFYPQQTHVSRPYPAHRFTQSYPSRTFFGPPSYPSRAYDAREPYPPSENGYDQRFSSSNLVPQTFPHPADYEYHDEPRYEFSYDVRGPYGPSFGHSESRMGHEARGQYYVEQPDGRRQVVHYEAGPGGYRPHIRYEPMLDYQDYPRA